MAADRFVLDNGLLQAEVMPKRGGGLSRLLAANEPVLRSLPACAAVPNDPNALACYPLVPWSNRIGTGQMRFTGQKFKIPLTRADEPLPIHGHGWLASWQVLDARPDALRLEYCHLTENPFRYRAVLDYQLEGPMLRLNLSVENLGVTLPFGLGFHPFFPRSAGTRLSALALARWESGSDYLPTAKVDVTPSEYGHGPAVLEDNVNHAFLGWPGCASIFQQAGRIDVYSDCCSYVLYTPAGMDFFCFEPVDHPINACNLPGGPEANGLTILQAGQRLQRQLLLRWSAK